MRTDSISPIDYNQLLADMERANAEISIQLGKANNKISSGEEPSIEDLFNLQILMNNITEKLNMALPADKVRSPDSMGEKAKATSEKLDDIKPIKPKEI